jgi:hypothetical protein
MLHRALIGDFPGWRLSRDAGMALGEPGFECIDDGF